MARKAFMVAVMVGLILLAATGVAQNNEVAGIIGRTFISDQGVPSSSLSDKNIHFGSGLSYEVSYARRFVDIGLASLAVELPFVHDPETKLNFGQNVVPRSYSAMYFTPSARLNFFPGSGVSPWISGGGGFAHFNESSTLVFGGPNPGSTGTTVGAVQLGVGLDVRFLGNVKLRGQVRDFYTGLPNLNINPQKHMHNYFAGAGIVWSF
jgi:opacity protein-like surface antigen